MVSDRIAYFPGSLHGSLFTGIREDNGELLASVATWHVFFRDEVAQQRAEFTENHVAHVMAIAVVELLKVIEITHEKTEGQLFSFFSAALMVLGLREVTPFVQPGQGVANSLPPEVLAEFKTCQGERGMFGHRRSQLLLFGSQLWVAAAENATQSGPGRAASVGPVNLHSRW